MGDGLIGIGEAGRMLGLSPSRVRQLVDQGLLSAELTEGGHRRFRPEVLRRESLERHRSSTRVPEWVAEFPLAGLAEDVVWAQVRSELGEIPEAARRILGYAVTEMANNAIDHSRGTTLRALLSLRGRTARVVLADDGIGAFQSMADSFGYDDVADAVVDLTKGKRTTDPQRHSGEGIFFTSKAVDTFSLDANGYRFVVDNRNAEVALGEGLAVGSTVTMTLDLDTTRKLVDVFAAYTENGEFVRTTPRIQLVQYGSEFLSRSEAKRFAAGLEEFEQVILDFTGVDLVGQGFADELFRVWQAEHATVRLDVTGANPGVALMIGRVAKP
jgi:anti-sigma regulatory factor (Ser/Thr protein kinase)